MENFDIEIISDEAKLYYHVPKAHFNNDGIDPVAFSPKGDSLSTNWEKYCASPLACLEIKTEYYPNGRTASTHGVGHFITEDIRKEKSWSVIHAPTSGRFPNQAHSLIQGIPPNRPKSPYNAMRKTLQRLFCLDIAPEI